MKAIQNKNNKLNKNLKSLNFIKIKILHVRNN
jgi:hypothetical protein